MELTFNWRIAVGTFVASYTSLGFYRLFLDPLARFPGPKLAALSRWYEAYYDFVQGGKYTLRTAQLHRQYGPIIRISPYEPHVDDPAFLKTLYSSDGGRRQKYDWSYNAFGAKSSVVFGWEHDAHKRRRAAIAYLFSKTSVAARQDTLQRNVIDKLCQHIASIAGKSDIFNLGIAVSALTRDAANEFMVGKIYDDLGSSTLGEGLTIASQGGGLFWRITKYIRWFGPSMRGMPKSWVEKIADEPMKTFLGYLQQFELDTRAAMKASESSSTDEKLMNSMIYAIVHSKLPPSDKTFNRIFEEVATATGAAFETTANVLRLIFFHVYSNEKILKRLREEVDSARQGNRDNETPLSLKNSSSYRTSPASSWKA